MGWGSRGRSENGIGKRRPNEVAKMSRTRQVGLTIITKEKFTIRV